MSIQRWRYNDGECRSRFGKKPFVSIDPGADGWALGWYPWSEAPVAFCHAYDPMALVELGRTVEATIFVVEAQYIGNLGMAGSVLEMTFRQGLALGWLGAVMHYSGKENPRKDLHLVQVPPSTWQAHQRRQAGIPGRLPRGEGIDLALKRARELVGEEDEWVKGTKKQREGMASAIGIGEWWRSLDGTAPPAARKKRTRARKAVA